MAKKIADRLIIYSFECIGRPLTQVVDEVKWFPGTIFLERYRVQSLVSNTLLLWACSSVAFNPLAVLETRTESERGCVVARVVSAGCHFNVGGFSVGETEIITFWFYPLSGRTGRIVYTAYTVFCLLFARAFQVYCLLRGVMKRQRVKTNVPERARGKKPTWYAIASECIRRVVLMHTERGWL